MNQGALNLKWASVMMAHLVAQGIRVIGFSAGSRSTPLVIAADRHPDIDLLSFVDERAMGFYMLGVAKSSLSATALITTSGTAVANLMPAVVEAYHAGVPLIILTADRPAELIDSGANQTITQSYFFGHYVKWHHTMTMPSDNVALSYIRHIAFQAASRASQSKQGPVHVNIPFRQPLVDLETLDDIDPLDVGPTPTRLISHCPSNLLSEGSDFFDLLINASSVLIIVGDLPLQYVPPILTLAETFNWPIIADIQSNIRSHQMVSPLGSLFIESNPTIEPFDIVLQFGSTFVSPYLLDWVQSHSHCWVWITDHYDGQNPVFGHTHIIHQDLQLFCTLCMKTLPPKQDSLCSVFGPSKAELRHLMDSLSPPIDSFNEYRVLFELAQYVAPHHALFLSNSLAVRAADFMLCGNQTRPISTFSNRGASGIDGVLSTALGVNYGLNCPVILVIGDQALIHDINSLLLVARSPSPIIIIVLQNKGGRIFEQLPIGAHSRLNQLFTLEHDLSFKTVCNWAKVSYHYTDHISDFNAIMSKVISINESTVIECAIEPKSGDACIRAIKQQLSH